METLQRTANRGSISTGFDIDNSLKLEKDNNEHLYRVMVEGNRKTWTYSCWIKRTELLQVNAQVLIHFGVNHHATRMFIDDNNDQIYLDVCSTENTLYRSITNRRFRDTSAWYHIVWRMDTTQGTEADRMRLYINGVEETSWSQHQIPPQNLETLANTTAGGYDDMGIGTYVWAGSSYDGQFSGYIAQVAHVDGQSYAPTEFGEFDNDSGIWKPKDVSGLTYGTSNNSFFLDFETASDLGANAKGNDVNFSLNNITAADQSTDTPTNNFCTWNVAVDNAGIFSYTEGATKWKPTSGNWASTTASLGFTKGKWYAEFKAASNVTNVMVGVQELSGNYVGGYSGEFANSTSEGYGYYNANGNVYNNGGNSSYGASFPVSVLVGVALDFKDDGTALMYISKDNVWQNSADPANGTGGYSLNSGNAVEGFFSFAGSLFQNNDFLQANFGGYTVNSISSAASDANGYGTFEYAPPSGYYALCTKNLAEYG